MIIVSMIRNRMNSADTNSEILQLTESMAEIELKQSKTVSVEQVGDATDGGQRETYYKAVSLEDILPESIVRHILGFNNERILQFINKSFKKYYDENIKTESKLQRNEFPVYDSNSNILIVSSPINPISTRELKKHLNKFVKISSINPADRYTDLKSAILNAQDGDIICVGRGVWGWFHEKHHGSNYVLDINNRIRIIGCSQDYGIDVLIQYNDINIRNDVWLENITISIAHGVWKHRGKNVSSSLFLNKCIIKFDMWDIYLTSRSALNILNCKFLGRRSVSHEAIAAVEWIGQTMTVTNCDFIECGMNKAEPIVSVDNKDNKTNIEKKEIKIIKLINNCFYLNGSLPWGSPYKHLKLLESQTKTMSKTMTKTIFRNNIELC